MNVTADCGVNGIWRVADLGPTVQHFANPPGYNTLEANANEEGHLYGSIMGHEISRALKAAGYAVEPDNVRLDGPLKELGMYTLKSFFTSMILLISLLHPSKVVALRVIR